MWTAVDRIPAGGTARVEFTVIPLKTGSGVTAAAHITYKLEEDAKNVQVGSQFQSPASRMQHI